MVDPDTAPEVSRTTTQQHVPSVVIDDLHVTYRVFEDQRPTLRRFIANRFKPRPYRAVEAVQGVSLTAFQGDSIGVIGRNGSGKSTLLRAVAGLLPPTQGAVYAHDVPVLLGVSAALQQELSGRRNIYLGCTALGMSRAEVEERFAEIVDFAGLRKFIDMPLRAYSSGMIARLQFSIATAVTPEILLIDEALAVGDAEFQHKSGERIKRLLGNAGTVFLVSHNLDSVEDLCNYVMWLDDGKMVMEGDPTDVVGAYKEETAA